MMSVEHAILVLEDVIMILKAYELNDYYLNQIIEAVDTLIKALPEDMHEEIKKREGLLLQ